MRWWYGAAALAILAALALHGCAFRYPSCGEFQARRRDGAMCRECVDRAGSYSECSRTE